MRFLLSGGGKLASVWQSVSGRTKTDGLAIDHDIR